MAIPEANEMRDSTAIQQKCSYPTGKKPELSKEGAFLCIKAKRGHPIGHKKGHHIASQRKVRQRHCVS